MKITRHKSINKRAVISILAVSAILLLIAIYLLNKTLTTSDTTNTKKNPDYESTIDLNPPTKDQIDQGVIIKNDTSNPSSNNNEIRPSVIITKPVNGEFVDNDLYIRTLIGSASTNDSCELMVSNNAKTITKTSIIQALSSSSTCQGFDIKKTDLSTGSWTVKIKIIRDNKEISSNSVEVVIK